MQRKDVAGKTVPKMEYPRPDENQLIGEDDHYACVSKVDNSLKFCNFPSFWNDQAPKLHVHNLLDDVHSPQVLLHDLVVLDLVNNVWLQFINA